MDSLSLAVVVAYKKAQEISYRYSKGICLKEKPWYAVPLWEGLDKAIVKSIWRKYCPLP
jgi:hypothetical protein